MNEELKFLKRAEIKSDWDRLLIKEIRTLYSYDGKICFKCGRIQGQPNKELGRKKYYCSWVGKAVHKKIKKEKEKLMGNIIDLILPSTLKDDL